MSPPPRAPLEKVFWVPNRFFKHELQPVIMGIRNGTRCLASTAAPQPTLRLQVGGGGWRQRGGGDSMGTGMVWEWDTKGVWGGDNLGMGTAGG